MISILSERLHSGNTVAFFSPSSPASATAVKRYARAKSFIRSNGLNILEGTLIGKSDFYRSGSIDERVNELNALIRNADVRCIIATIGGMNSNSILPYIDYESLKRDPKIIIGYSDVTAILLAVYAKIGLVTYYGPAVVSSFGEFPPFVNETFKYFADILMKKVELPFKFPTPPLWTQEFIDWTTQDRGKTSNTNELITVNGGQATGRLIGGNLNTMTGIWNTEYMPEIKYGDILLIEDSLKDASTIERSFSLLKLSGVFDKIGGLILGKHEKFDDCGTGRLPYEILNEVIGTANFPILAEFDCCHTHPMLTMPIGCTVSLDAIYSVKYISQTGAKPVDNEMRDSIYPFNEVRNSFFDFSDISKEHIVYD